MEIGHILLEIVKRYIEDCLKNDMSIKEIKRGLENDIYAFETDNIHYINCINNLNKLAEKYRIKDIQWKNIQLADALKQEQNEKFEYVIGNPPYIKYKSLAEKDREYIKKNFSTCVQGKFDYCYAFIEKSIKSLREGGVMAYLIPSSIFKNVFADKLREFIKPHLIAIYDYTIEKLFKEDINGKPDIRLTSSAVILIKKNTNADNVLYYDVVKNKKIKIKKENLNDKWIFYEENKKKHNAEKFGDYFKVSNAIATLYNNAYVIKSEQEDKEDKNYIYLKDGNKIEKELIKETASPRNLRNEKKEKIIFPYKYIDGKIERYTDEEFNSKFKNTVEYLNTFKEHLEKRKSDENAKWFEYGRSQSLSSIKDCKLLVSTVVTKEVNVYDLEDNTIPYSGLYIQPIGEKTLQEAKEILKSDKFLKYIEKIGIHASGESYRITSKDIKNYEL